MNKSITVLPVLTEDMKFFVQTFPVFFKNTVNPRYNYTRFFDTITMAQHVISHKIIMQLSVFNFFYLMINCNYKFRFNDKNTLKSWFYLCRGNFS